MFAPRLCYRKILMNSLYMQQKIIACYRRHNPKKNA